MCRAAETLLSNKVRSGLLLSRRRNKTGRVAGDDRCALDPAQLARHCRDMAEETDILALSFEDALKRLEAIVQQLETGDVPLDRSIELYAEGDKLRAQCLKRLADAQARIDKIIAGSDGRISGAEPFGAG